jgi:excisionase family DNA binding protein
MFHAEEILYLTTKETAELLGIEPQTLRLWRHKGKGPAPIIASSRCVFYKKEEVEAFMAEATKVETKTTRYVF